MPWLSLLWLVAGCIKDVVEPWGRCPGMRPMRKWLFGRYHCPILGAELMSKNSLMQSKMASV